MKSDAPPWRQWRAIVRREVGHDPGLLTYRDFIDQLRLARPYAGWQAGKLDLPDLDDGGPGRNRDLEALAERNAAMVADTPAGLTPRQQHRLAARQAAAARPSPAGSPLAPAPTF